MRCLLAATALLLGGCGMLGGGGSGLTPSPQVPSDPTPLARCKVAASASSPLVTEWPASEKAHLESLSAGSAVAVQYSGCELVLLDACKPSGRYGWRRTTLATDSVEVTNADDLWAKLPLGAAALEAELGRSGRLAVRTTVAGQLALEQFDEAALARDPACARATHVITGISVGAFSLLSGGSASASGGGSVAGVGAGAKSTASERVMRTAGDPEKCGEAEEGAPHRECASPIQLFLQPIGAAAQTSASTSGPAGAPAAPPPASEGIEIAFVAPEGDERWSLRNAEGLSLCSLPCTRVVPKVSGYYLERTGPGASVDRVELPARLPFEPGSHVTASYRAERGSPLLSKLAFYGMGIPAAVGGLVTLGLGIAASTSDDPDDRDKATFWFIGTGMYLGAAAGTFWWFSWSHEASFEAKEQKAAGASTPLEPRAAGIGVGPGFVSGTF